MASNIIFPEPVLKDFNQLPNEIKLKFFSKIEILLRNPAYPSLRHEKLEGTNAWAFSLTMNYRVTYIGIRDDIAITAIGTHKDTLGN